MSENRKSAPNVHRIKIGRGPGPRGEWGLCPPQLKITGSWLVDYGFVPGDWVWILAVPGRLVVIQGRQMPPTDEWKEAMALLRSKGGCCMPLIPAPPPEGG